MYAGMPRAFVRRATAFYDELSTDELDNLGIPTDLDADDLTPRYIVLLAEEIARREATGDATDDVLIDTHEDYYREE